MRIGLGLEMGGSIDEIVARARVLASTGAVSLWSSQIFGWDTLTVLAAVGREVPGVELGTAVIPIHPRHPMMLAEQALTVQAASGGRLVLGIGLSHQVVVEGVWGYSFDKPARYMKEYLSVLVPLLHGEQVSFNGEVIRTNTFGPLDVVPTPPPPVLVAALGPTMLRLAGELADGTVTWMVGPATVEQHIVPAITAAASAAGRPAPQVVVTLPVCVTDDPDAARARADKIFAMYGQLPSYRAMLDREGAAGPAQVAVVGNEEEVTAQIRRLADGGATEFSGAVYGSPSEVARAQTLLGALATASN
ncbi:MAG TPA: TIGR03564 family F420-dependent LLM class oxidoreductase [Acidimicrobiales bacterium]